MPNEQYLDANGLNKFWSQVKAVIGPKTIDRCIWITSAGDNLSYFAKDQTWTAGLSEFVGAIPKVTALNNPEVGLILVNNKVYWSTFSITSVTGNSVDMTFTQDPILIGPSESDNTNLAPGILLYASVADPIQKNHSTTMTKSGFIGPLPNVDDAGYGLLAYDKKLYQVAYHISSIDSNGLYTIVYDGDPLLIGPSEGGSGGTILLNSLNRQLAITQSQWTETDGVYQCTVACDGAIANELVQNIYSTPAASYQSAYEECGVKCVGQGTDTLTYQAKSLPPDLLMYVTIVNAGEITTNLVAWSPEMKSNTTPAPYVVSGINVPDVTDTRFMFDNKISDSNYTPFIANVDSSVTIDMAVPVTIYGVQVFYPNKENIPKEYSILGSADGNEYVLISTVKTTGDELALTAYQIDFIPVSYRYYRVYMNTAIWSPTSTRTQPRIGEMKFLRPASDVGEVS